MKYIRTNRNEIYCLDDFTKSDKMVDCYVAKYFHRCINKNEIIKQADTIEDLIQEGDLVRYEDRTTLYPYQTLFTEIAEFFSPVGTAIYRVVELYIKQPNGDYKLVARDKDNYNLELV